MHAAQWVLILAVTVNGTTQRDSPSTDVEMMDDENISSSPGSFRGGKKELENNIVRMMGDSISDTENSPQVQKALEYSGDDDNEEEHDVKLSDRTMESSWRLKVSTEEYYMTLGMCLGMLASLTGMAIAFAISNHQ